MIVAWAGRGSELAGSIQQSHLLLLTMMAGRAELWCRQAQSSKHNYSLSTAAVTALSACCACLSPLQRAGYLVNRVLAAVVKGRRNMRR